MSWEAFDFPLGIAVGRGIAMYHWRRVWRGSTLPLRPAAGRDGGSGPVMGGSPSDRFAFPWGLHGVLHSGTYHLLVRSLRKLQGRSVRRLREDARRAYD